MILRLGVIDRRGNARFLLLLKSAFSYSNFNSSWHETFEAIKANGFCFNDILCLLIRSNLGMWRAGAETAILCNKLEFWFARSLLGVGGL